MLIPLIVSVEKLFFVMPISQYFHSTLADG